MPRAVLVLPLIALALAACGRKGALETPVTYEQAVPWTAAGQAAITPQRDANGKLIEPPTRPRPVPAQSTFILDPLLD